MCMRTPLCRAVFGIDTSRSREAMNLIIPVCSSLLTSCSDDKFKNFMDPIVASFTKDFEVAFAEWLTTDKDNYSTRAFLMAGPQKEGAPNP